MTRFLCWLGWHRHEKGTNPSMALIFLCQRCQRLIPGNLSTR